MEYSEQERKILDAALEVISRETISGTRMHLIAQESGMVQSNLHYHFKTKNELLRALFLYIQESYQDKRAGYLACGDTLSAQVHSFFLQKKLLLRSDPKYDLTQFDFWVYGHTDEDIHRLFNDSYAEWHDHITEILRRYRPNLNEQTLSMTAYAMISLTTGAAMQYLSNDANFDLDRYFDLCEQMVLAQLGPDL